MTTPRIFRTLACSLCALTLALIAPGCGGTNIRGTVVGSPIGRALIVDARDERLVAPGIPGVTVKLARVGTETSGGIAPLATTTTDDMGRFTMRIADREKLRGHVVLVTESDGSFRTATRIYPPREGQEVLVNVRERPSAGADGTTE